MKKPRLAGKALGILRRFEQVAQAMHQCGR